MSDNQILLTPMQAKDILGVGKSQIYKLCKTNGFPVCVIGKKYYINRAKLQEWVNKQCK